MTVAAAPAHARMLRMHRPDPDRRRLLGGVLALALVPAEPACALDAPAGKVVLTISGRLRYTNQRATAALDLALLQRLPQHSFSTRTPWYAQPRKFSGVLLGDLLRAVGAHDDVTTVRAVALNDYRVDIPSDDLTENGAMLAYLLDDKPMSVREKGPLVIIYPFDDEPALRTPVHYSRAVWQLERLELR